MEKQLIELVKGSEFLYRKSDKRYKNVYYRDEKWTEIAKILGKEVTAVKKRWKTLRDKFNLEHKKRIVNWRSRRGQSTPIWKYYECMSFLKDEYDERNTARNMPSTRSADMSYSKEVELPEEVIPKLERRSTPDKSTTERESTTSPVFPDDFLKQELSFPAKIEEDPLLKKFDEFLEKANRILNKPAEEPQKSSRTKDFFICLSNDLDNANLSESSLRQIKRNVLYMVYDAIDNHQNK